MYPAWAKIFMWFGQVGGAAVDWAVAPFEGGQELRGETKRPGAGEGLGARDATQGGGGGRRAAGRRER